MLFSKKCVYALRATLYIAKNNSDGYVSISAISDDLKVSFHFLTKILQILTRHKLMKSYRGPNGGINLAKPAGDITVLEIVNIIDGEKTFRECILGLPNCDEKHPCPLHDKWISSCEDLKNSLASLTIKDLVLDLKKLNLRLTA